MDKKLQSREAFLKKLGKILDEDFGEHNFPDLVVSVLGEGQENGFYQGDLLSADQATELYAIFLLGLIDDRKNILIEMLELKKHFPELNLE